MNIQGFVSGKKLLEVSKKKKMKDKPTGTVVFHLLPGSGTPFHFVPPEEEP